MVGILPTGVSLESFGEKRSGRRWRRGLPNHGDRSVLLDDGIPSRRPHRASHEAGETRALQALANLLSPIAGADAEAEASRLITRFGSLSQAMRVDPLKNDLSEEERHALRPILAAQQLLHAALFETFHEDVLDFGSREFRDYLRLHLAMSSQEKLLAVFLTQRGRYISDEIVSVGELSSVSFPNKYIVRRAVELGSNIVLLAHNHPSGTESPSEADVFCTTRIRDSLAQVEIELADHLIVAGSSIFSIRQGGRLRSETCLND